MASLLHLPQVEAPLALAEMRRVLRPGGAIFLGLQEGESEGWEKGRYGPVEGFFSRYTREEATGLLTSAHFTLQRAGSHNLRNRPWLFFLAAR
jgi:ubiquinone/menaquinone biosynthesis C-methylase UbiE